MPSTMKKWILILIGIYWIASAHAVYSQPVDGGEDSSFKDEYTVNEGFVPQTKDQKLASWLNYYNTVTRDSAIPCDLLQVRYQNSFPAETVTTIGSNGAVTSDQYKNLIFLPLHLQKYEPGEKRYYKLATYAFPSEKTYINGKIKDKAEALGRDLIDEEKAQVAAEAEKTFETERTAFAAKYPDGEIVGWISFKAAKIDELLSSQGINCRNTPCKHQPIIDKGQFISYTMLMPGGLISNPSDQFSGDMPAVPIIYDKRYPNIEYHETRIAYEICSRPAMHSLKGDYTDIKNDWLNSEILDGYIHTFFSQKLAKGAYDYSNYDFVANFNSLNDEVIPTELAFWNQWPERLRSDSNKIAAIEVILKILQLPAYMLPIEGTALAAIDCHNSSEPACWAGVGLSGAADALWFLKIPAVSTKVAKGVSEVYQAATFTHKYLKVAAGSEPFIVGVQKLLDGLETSIGIANWSIGLYYLHEGKIFAGLAQGFAGSFEVGLFNATKKYFRLIPLGKWNGKCAPIHENVNVSRLESNLDEHASCARTSFQKLLNGKPENGNYNEVWRDPENSLVYRRPFSSGGSPRELAAKYVKVSKEVYAKLAADRTRAKLYPNDEIAVFELASSSLSAPDFYTGKLAFGRTLNDLFVATNGDPLVYNHFKDRIDTMVDDARKVVKDLYPFETGGGAGWFGIGNGYGLLIDPKPDNFFINLDVGAYLKLRTLDEQITMLQNAKTIWFDPYAIKTGALFQGAAKNNFTHKACVGRRD
jgi:hypothetical protein